MEEARQTAGRAAGPAAGLCAGLIFALAAGCGLEKTIEITQDIVAGGGPPTLSQELAGATLIQAMAASSAELDKVSSVKLSYAALESTDADTEGINFVQSLDIKVKAPNLPERQIASIFGQRSGRSAPLGLDDVELKPYLTAGAIFTTRIEYALQPVTARGLRVVLRVKAEL